VRRLKILGVIAAAVVIGVVVAMAPWTSPPPITYETVSGWPMRVVYRNLGNGPERLSAVGGLPAFSFDEPLSGAQIEDYFATLRHELKPSPTLVKSGDVAWFEITDPGGLAYIESQVPGRTTYFYVFAIVEMPRGSIFSTKWVSELCLVAKTKEAFKKCPVHNEVYAGS
jgi:hypothetical protein